MEVSHDAMADHAGAPVVPVQDHECRACSESAPANASTACTPDCAAMAGCTLVFPAAGETGSLVPTYREHDIAYSQHALSRSAAPELPPPRA
jgi:hypothetical protein